MARLTKLFGMDVSRFSKLLGEHIEMNAATGLGNVGTGEATAKGKATSSGDQPGVANKPRQKSVKVKRAQMREKKVKGPKARRRRRAD